MLRFVSFWGFLGGYGLFAKNSSDSMDRFKTKSDGYGLCKTRFAPNITGSEKEKCHIQERCTRLPALTAERNVKFRSSQTVPGQFIAASATQNEDHHADIKHLS